MKTKTMKSRCVTRFKFVFASNLLLQPESPVSEQQEAKEELLSGLSVKAKGKQREIETRSESWSEEEQVDVSKVPCIPVGG